MKCFFTDPCKGDPCGDLGVCLPDGNSYKCNCSDGKTTVNSCTIPTSSIPVMLSTTIVPTTTMMSPIPSPSKYSKF